MRKEYSSSKLDREDLDPNPFKQFSVWFEQAAKAGVLEHNAMTLCTCGSDGVVSGRAVLLKHFDAAGFVFYTNYSSRKSKQIESNAHVALVFVWQALERQVRIEGLARRLDAHSSDQYFASRPRGAQIGAHASEQSSVIASRAELDQRVAELEKKFAGKNISRPQNWGGIVVEPERIEFWQGRPDRLSDRLLYSKAGTSWMISRLAP